MRTRLLSSQDALPLAIFRIVFGLAGLAQVLFLWLGIWVQEYQAQRIHFKFYGFQWVPSLPAEYASPIMFAICAFAFLAAIGFLTRISTFLFTAGLSWIVFSDITAYQNHYYLLILLGALLTVSPAGRLLSIDVLIRPERARSTAPAIYRKLIVFQLAIPFVFGAVAKLNMDWLSAAPMSFWLKNRTGLPVIGHFFALDWSPYVMAWGGLLFDAAIVPALIWPRTRVAAIIAALGFNTLNSVMWQIDVFPWFLMASMPMFFGPDWFRRHLSRFAKLPPEPEESSSQVPRNPRLLVAFGAIWVAFQVIVPLRHYAYPGNVLWTTEGYYFSWRMMESIRWGQTHWSVLHVPSNHLGAINLNHYLTPWQQARMAVEPDLVVRFAEFLHKDMVRVHGPEARLKVDVLVSLNRRQPARIFKRHIRFPITDRGFLLYPHLMPMPETPPGEMDKMTY